MGEVRGNGRFYSATMHYKAQCEAPPPHVTPQLLPTASKGLATLHCKRGFRLRFEPNPTSIYTEISLT